MSRSSSLFDGTTLTNSDDASDPEYYGYTRPGGSWVIVKNTESSGETVLVAGNGMSAYETAWTNRASLVYQRAGDFKSL